MITLNIALNGEETRELVEFVTNEAPLGFFRHLVLVQQLMGNSISGEPPCTLINQLLSEYAKTQRDLLGTLIIQIKHGKEWEPLSFRDSYSDTLLLQIKQELVRKSNEAKTNSSSSFFELKKIYLSLNLTSQDLESLLQDPLAKSKSNGIFPHWMFVAGLMGIEPIGWHPHQSELIEKLKKVLIEFRLGHINMLRQFFMALKVKGEKKNKEVTQEQEERLAFMMKTLNQLFMFPIPP